MAKSKIPPLSFKFSDLFTADYRLITALLIALPLLIYAQVWNFEFVWDDNASSKAHLYHPFVLNQTFENFIRLFAQPYFDMYIPVTYLFWSGLKGLSELLSLPLNSVLHLTNVVVHIINGLLVFTILRQFVVDKKALLIGSLFFLLHPIQVEVVAFVSEFRSLLAFAFSLSALYIYLKNQAKFGFLSLFLFILAILSKPSAVTLVAFIFVINYFHYGVKFSKNIKKILPFAVLALIFILIARWEQFVSPDYMIVLWQRPFAWLDSIVFYLVKLIYPYHLGLSYTLSPQFISTQWWFYPLAIVPFGLGYLLWIKRQIYPLLVLAAVLFLAGFFTTSGFVSFVFQKYSLVADRYLYFAMIGVALFVAAILEKSDNKIKQGLIVAILLVFTSLSAFRQIPLWQTPLSIWSHTKQYELIKRYAHENLAAMLFYRGDELRKAGNNSQALDYFNRSIEQYPQYSKSNLSVVLGQRGVIFFQQKKYHKALSDFTQAIELTPRSTQLISNKILTLLILKKCKKAYETFNLAGKNKIKLQAGTLIDLQKNCAK
ncbi:hypothetical protein SPONN_793 [uncultured Candidatus Thioglobus sp.]|nr:hypothetical protein SPONN_793 [uncultured Candidatus Thioglobus sp.]